MWQIKGSSQRTFHRYRCLWLDNVQCQRVELGGLSEQDNITSHCPGSVCVCVSVFVSVSVCVSVSALAYVPSLVYVYACVCASMYV